jgi:hypothetical protein
LILSTDINGDGGGGGGEGNEPTTPMTIFFSLEND